MTFITFNFDIYNISKNKKKSHTPQSHIRTKTKREIIIIIFLVI